jgi:hypothetical protein
VRSIGRRGPLEWDIDTRNRNRLRFDGCAVIDAVATMAEATEVHYLGPDAEPCYLRHDANRGDFSLSFGNGNSDPVWRVDLRCWVPKWIGMRLPG